MLERAGEVDDAHQRHLVDRARGGLREHAGDGRRAMLGHHHRARLEGRGRAQHGADIVRIADLVEGDDDAAAGGGRQLAQQVVEIGFGQRLDLEREPLMHRGRRQQRGKASRSSTSRAAPSATAALGDRGGKKLLGLVSWPASTARRRQRRSGLASAAATVCRP